MKVSFIQYKKFGIPFFRFFHNSRVW